MEEINIENIIKERIDALEYDRIGEVNQQSRDKINIKTRELRYILKKCKEERLKMCESEIEKIKEIK